MGSDELLDASGRAVEAFGEPRDLVTAFDFDPRGQIAGAERLDASLEQHIRRTIREQTSPRHVPQYMFSISEVPVTRSGKPVELSVKAILAGREISNREALANPQVLPEFERIREQLLQRHAVESPSTRRTPS